MVAYFDWMKKETSRRTRSPGAESAISGAIVPNAENGKEVYAKQCAVCPGKEGEGLKDADGRVVYPPLWGDNSFNIGAGMARTYTAAPSSSATCQSASRRSSRWRKADCRIRRRSTSPIFFAPVTSGLPA